MLNVYARAAKCNLILGPTYFKFKEKNYDW